MYKESHEQVVSADINHMYLSSLAKFISY